MRREIQSFCTLGLLQECDICGEEFTYDKMWTYMFESDEEGAPEGGYVVMLFASTTRIERAYKFCDNCALVECDNCGREFPGYFSWMIVPPNEEDAKPHCQHCTRHPRDIDYPGYVRDPRTIGGSLDD